ncbi:MAG: hypothetical protein E7195_01840 [Peptococcaceae bacterium]|nr:hypothetical protein [Peptococcaceae bacterium]
MNFLKAHKKIVICGVILLIVLGSIAFMQHNARVTYEERMDLLSELENKPTEQLFLSIRSFARDEVIYELSSEQWEELFYQLHQIEYNGKMWDDYLGEYVIPENNGYRVFISYERENAPKDEWSLWMADDSSLNCLGAGIDNVSIKENAELMQYLGSLFEN